MPKAMQLRSHRARMERQEHLISKSMLFLSWVAFYKNVLPTFRNLTYKNPPTGYLFYIWLCIYSNATLLTGPTLSCPCVSISLFSMSEKEWGFWLSFDRALSEEWTRGRHVR